MFGPDGVEMILLELKKTVCLVLTDVPMLADETFLHFTEVRFEKIVSRFNATLLRSHYNIRYII